LWTRQYRRSAGAVTPCPRYNNTITVVDVQCIDCQNGINYLTGGGELNQEEVIRELSRLSAEVSYLKERDTQLNGTIFRVDQKVDKLQFWIMASAVGAGINILVNIAK